MSVITIHISGGQGDIPGIECDDLIACWKRWDTQHDIHKPELVGTQVKIKRPGELQFPGWEER
jgi:hypothetical protein